MNSSDDPGPFGYGPEVTDAATAARLEATTRLEGVTGEIIEAVDADDAPGSAEDIDNLAKRIRATYQVWRNQLGS